MEATGRYFARALRGNAGQQHRFVRRGTTRFLVVKKFTPEESSRLDAAVARGDLVFTDTGDVQVPDASGAVAVVALNPLVDEAHRALGGRTLQELRAESGEQYVWGSTAVVNRTLRFLLLKDGGTWHLCHNPLHERGFREYYAQVLQDAPSEPAWGMPDATTTHPTSIRRLLRDYCTDLVVAHDGHAAYLDPTCNIFYSQQACVESAFLPTLDNRVDHASDPVRKRIFDLNTDHYAFLKAAGTAWKSNCLCTGNAAAYADTNLTEDSFLIHDSSDRGKRSSFLGRRACELDVVINNSNIVVDTGGGDLEVTNSTFEAAATSNSVEPPTEDETASTPDPPTPASTPEGAATAATTAAATAAASQRVTWVTTEALLALAYVAAVVAGVLLTVRTTRRNPR